MRQARPAWWPRPSLALCLEIVRGWPDRPDELTPEAVTALAVDRHDRLWIGLTDGSISQMSDEGRAFIRYAGGPSAGPGPGGTNISTIVIARDDTVWIGTRTGG